MDPPSIKHVSSLPCSEYPPLDPILSQFNPVRILIPYLYKIHLISIAHVTPRPTLLPSPLTFSDRLSPRARYLTLTSYPSLSIV